jgi:hypothetical protein
MVFITPSFFTIYKMGAKGYFKYMRIYLNFIFTKPFMFKNYKHQNTQFGIVGINISRYTFTFLTFYNGNSYALTTYEIWKEPNKINNKNIYQIYTDSGEVKTNFAFEVEKLDCFILNFITYIVGMYLVRKHHKFTYIGDDFNEVVKKKIRLEKIKKVF